MTNLAPRALRQPAPVLLVLSGALTLACGHPATEAECREILRTAAQLELKARLENDEALIAQELAEIEKSMSAAMSDKCVGKRVTEGVMSCVRSAKTADELFEECFR